MNGRVVILLASAVLLLSTSAFGQKKAKFMHIMSLYTDEKKLGLKQPEGITCNEESRFIVSDTGNGRLLQYVLQDKAIKPGSVEIKFPEIPYPKAITEEYSERIPHIRCPRGSMEISSGTWSGSGCS